MRIFNSLYPYPVLSVQDDDYHQDSHFSVNYQIEDATPFKKAKLLATFNLSDAALENLISEGKAAMFLHVESPRSAYRHMYRVDNNFQVIEIDPDCMRSSVEITGFILATEEIEGYSSPNVNEDLYGSNYIFPILRTGDPLAVAFTFEVTLTESDDFAQVSSIMKVASTKEGQMRVDYDQDTIFVYLPKAHYDYYIQYASRFGEVMLSSIIQPTLIYVLDAIVKHKAEDMKDRKWYQVIEKKLELLGYSMYQLLNEELNSIALTHEILQNPLERLFAELGGMLDDD